MEIWRGAPGTYYCGPFSASYDPSPLAILHSTTLRRCRRCILYYWMTMIEWRKTATGTRPFGAYEGESQR